MSILDWYEVNGITLLLGERAVGYYRDYRQSLVHVFHGLSTDFVAFTTTVLAWLAHHEYVQPDHPKTNRTAPPVITAA